MKDSEIRPMKGILWPTNALQYQSETKRKKNGFQSIYQKKKKKKERSPLVLFSFLLIWECFSLVGYSTYSNRQRARIYYQSKDRWDFDEREVTYKDRAMNAKKTVYLPSCLGPNPKPAYSEWTVLPVFTPRSTRSLFFVLFRVRRFILSSPSQNSPTKLPKPCL